MIAAHIRLDSAFCLDAAETVASATYVDLSTASWDRIVDGAIECQHGPRHSGEQGQAIPWRPLGSEDSPREVGSPSVPVPCGLCTGGARVKGSRPAHQVWEL
jgi:hypothetical protein